MANFIMRNILYVYLGLSVKYVTEGMFPNATPSSVEYWIYVISLSIALLTYALLRDRWFSKK